MPLVELFCHSGVTIGVVTCLGEVGLLHNSSFTVNFMNKMHFITIIFIFRIFMILFV